MASLTPCYDKKDPGQNQGPLIPLSGDYLAILLAAALTALMLTTTLLAATLLATLARLLIGRLILLIVTLAAAALTALLAALLLILIAHERVLSCVSGLGQRSEKLAVPERRTRPGDVF